MKLLYLSLVSLVFIISFIFGFQVRANAPQIKLFNIQETSELPVLTNNKSFPVLSGQGIIAVDESSNVTLYEKDADRELYPASTTKIMTALISMEYFKADQVLTVAADLNVDGQKMGLTPGEQITFDNLVNGLLIYSANDAAETLAANYPGGRDSFINAMNNKVQELHLDHTHFSNPVGLDDETQVTTARDMVRLSQIAMQNPYFAQIVSTKEKIVKDVAGRTFDVTNVNKLLGTVDGVLGIKTGWTEAARENLVTYVVRNNHKVFITILGSQDRFGETKELIDWIYGSYAWHDVNFLQRAVGSL